MDAPWLFLWGFFFVDADGVVVLMNVAHVDVEHWRGKECGQ